MKLLKQSIKYLSYLFVFLLPWQTKLILRPAETNFNEISLYLSHIVLIFILILFAVYKAKKKEDPEKLPWLWYLLAGLEVFIFVSILVAPDKVLAIYHYIVLLIALGLFYVLRDETKVENYVEAGFNKLRFIYIFLISIFLQSVLGIYQFLTQQSFAFKYLGLASHSPEILGSAVIETATGRWLRAYGGLDHPNIFGGVLAIALLISVYLLVKKKIINSRRQANESLFLFVFYFIALFALFFTFSRSAWLAFAVGLLILLFHFIASKDRWIIGRFAALLVFSGILLSTAVIPYMDLIQTRLTASSRLEQMSINERMGTIEEANHLFKGNPILGVGIGNYSTALSIKDDKQSPAWAYQPVHSSFLLLLVESGAISLLFFLSFLFYLIKKDRREDFSWAIFIPLLILMLLDHWLFSLPFGVLFLFLVLGLI